MKEGFYSVTYTGQAGLGFGILVFDTGTVVGADTAGGKYDGTYQYNARTDLLDVQVKVTIPPGVWTVQGVPAQPSEYSFPVIAALPRELDKECTLSLNTPLGPVVATIKKVRDFPS